MPNFLVLIGCAFIPFIIASVWFHPKVFGGETWKNVAGLSEAQFQKPVKPLQLGASIILNFLLAFGVFLITVHQTHVLALTGPDIEAFKGGTALAFMQEYGDNFRTWQHGISHGLFIGLLFFVIPILGYAVIFERKSMKYLFINAGFWGISLMIMACVISKWGGIPVY